jgi:hypothetical protein
VASALEAFESGSRKVKARLKAVTASLRFYDVPPDLQARVIDSLEYFWAQQSSNDDSELIPLFPERCALVISLLLLNLCLHITVMSEARYLTPIDVNRNWQPGRRSFVCTDVKPLNGSSCCSLQLGWRCCAAVGWSYSVRFNSLVALTWIDQRLQKSVVAHNGAGRSKAGTCQQGNFRL